MSDPAQLVVLTAGGTTLLVDVAGPDLPRVLHWGPELGPIDDVLAADLALARVPAVAPASLDEPMTLTLLPSQGDGWTGRPGISGHRDGGWPHPRLRLTEPVRVDRTSAAQTLVVTAADPAAGIAVRGELRLTEHGVVRVRHEVRNSGTGWWSLDELLCLLPLPAAAAELLDLTGRWCRERVPQRSPVHFGMTTRESRRGRTGHDATLLMVAGTPGFGFRTGQVWAVHIEWSGNHQHLVQRQVEGAGVLGGGELLLPGEVRLAPGESYRTPWASFGYSGDGLDGLSARLHGWLRGRDNHPRTPRPVVLNTWEAVYFDHRLDRLTALADRAAEIGVERFVLDDGWFTGRRDDTAGLGDWYVDEKVWPEGLHPLVAHVRSRGMQFGLWVEPEMVNPDSDLARAHPDWLLVAPERPARSARHQQVLDVARPEVFAYLLDRLDALVSEYQIDYLKWDHNRDLLEAVHNGPVGAAADGATAGAAGLGDPAGMAGVADPTGMAGVADPTGMAGVADPAGRVGAAGVHRQTEAVYRLLAALRARHPGLEIESCSSGGARIDLGILGHTDRVWVSDTNDPLERQQIQRWTGLLLPLELMGTHVGPRTAHTTGRTTGLRFRCVTALFGHVGLEWDLTECTPAELSQLTGWISRYRRLRGLLHSGVLVRADHADPSVSLTGVVSADRGHAVFAYAKLDTSTAVVPAPICLPGLAPDTRYTVSVCPELAPEAWLGHQRPGWLRGAGITLTGAALERYGLAAPPLAPADAALLELRAVATPARTQ